MGHRYSGFWHLRLRHSRLSTDGKADTVNTRPVTSAAEVHKSFCTRHSLLTETQGQDSAHLQPSPALGAETATVRDDHLA